MLAGGIWTHINFIRELRSERAALIAQTLIHGQSSYPLSVTLVAALLLLLLGLVAVFGMVVRAGPLN